jgi:hypothetical protein
MVDRSYRGPRPRRDKTVKKMVGSLLVDAVPLEAARTTGRGCSRVRPFD